jgi:hypothetical protein
MNLQAEGQTFRLFLLPQAPVLPAGHFPAEADEALVV